MGEREARVSPGWRSLEVDIQEYSLSSPVSRPTRRSISVRSHSTSPHRRSSPRTPSRPLSTPSSITVSAMRRSAWPTWRMPTIRRGAVFKSCLTGYFRLLAQTTLRNMLGTRSLSEILSDRDALACSMQTLLDEATESWGIKVERVEMLTRPSSPI